MFSIVEEMKGASIHEITFQMATRLTSIVVCYIVYTSTHKGDTYTEYTDTEEDIHTKKNYKYNVNNFYLL